MKETFEQQAMAFGPRGALFGLDVGDKTIGIAVCDPNRFVATPIDTVRRQKFTLDVAHISRLLTERKVTGIVIGLPRNMDGTEGPRAQSTRAFARNLGNKVDLPIAMWDERLSTAAMERDMIALDESRAKRAAKIDEAAAAFILQGAIDRIRASGD